MLRITRSAGSAASVIKISLALNLATPVGVSMVAVETSPSFEPATPVPARVLTALVLMSTNRTILLPESATTAVSSGKTAIRSGVLKKADNPTPFTRPEIPLVLPASVETVMEPRSTTRIAWLPVSATRSSPLALSATP